MTDGGDDVRLDLRALLAAVEAAPPISAVDVLAAELGRMVEASSVGLLIANFSGTAVMRMSHVALDESDPGARRERAESLPLEGSVHEEVLIGQEQRVERRDDGTYQVLLPVTERGDAIGILEVTLPSSPDDETSGYLASAAHALAYVLIASRRHTDIFEWAQRDEQFSLAAEMQRRLLPSSYTLEAGSLTLAGWLEPAAKVGGDTFDYSLDRGHLYASITDAIGHGTDAALLATLTVGSLRNSRRAVATPAEQAAAANRAVLGTADPHQFVTGHVLRVCLLDGRVELVNAGHPPPYLLRDGKAIEIDVPPCFPLGIEDAPFDTFELPLRPGDRLLLVTDGFLERNAVEVPIPHILEETASRHPREVVRELSGNVLAATGGNLRDDATVLCIDWYGGDGSRDAESGATTGMATSA